MFYNLEAIKQLFFDFKEIVGLALGTILLISGAIWRRRQQNKKDFLYSDKVLNESNITVTKLRREKLKVEGKNYYLQRVLIEMVIDCEDCAKGKIEKLPKKLQQEIKELILENYNNDD